jgi:secernin
MSNHNELGYSLSCDSSVAVQTATVDGSVIFAKNSDRAPNECQPLCHVPRRRHRSGATLACQYIELPQVKETWEVIGSRPYWLWGFEIGVNEWGVAIGNEAVLSREPFEERALLGMDLVRLGLERATTAVNAVEVIGQLVERHGQGGSCEATHFRTYHNSFIVADANGAWILETAGRRWVAQCVEDRAAISNLYTIEQSWDAASPDIVEHAERQGWVTGAFSFAAAYQDPELDLSPRICRLDRARSVLCHRPPIRVEDMQALLRDHDGDDLPMCNRMLPTLCMHLTNHSPGETAAAMVAHLRPSKPRELRACCWTAFGSPCLSIFRPVYPFAIGLPAVLEQGGRRYDPESPWWVFEHLQRLVAQAPILAVIAQPALLALENRFRADTAEAEAEAEQLLLKERREEAIAVLRQLVDSTTERSLALAQRLITELTDRADELATPGLTGLWADVNRDAGMPRIGRGRTSSSSEQATPPAQTQTLRGSEP